jgi:hypothetical protein
MDHLLRWAVACALLTGGIVARSSLAAQDSREVVMRGHAVCLDRDGTPLATGAACPDAPAGGWALRTGDGILHRLSPADPRVVMLTDRRVRARELQITAWQDEDGQLAIVHLYTVIDGRLHEPYYYCTTCSIRAYTPGLCWCCQKPFEFREPPVEGEVVEDGSSPPGP